jgi:hypothetical protein
MDSAPPPLFGDLVGKPTRGTVVPTPRPTPAWGAVFHAVSDLGDETFRVRLEPMSEPPPGAQVGFRGEQNGLVSTVKARWVERRGGQLGIDWSYHVDDTPARQQIPVLRFLRALHGTGELTITDDLSGRPELKHPLTSRSFELEHLLGFLEDVIEIEDWTGQELRLPESADSNETTWVAEVAAAIRRGAMKMRWAGTSVVASPEDLPALPARRAIRVEHELQMTLLGQTVNFGWGLLDVPDAEVRDGGAIDGGPTSRRVDILPPNGEPFTSAWGLLPPAR